MSKAPAAETVHLSTGDKPYIIRLIGPSLPTFAEAAAHIRQGYIFDSNMPVEFFGYSGNVAITLHRGNPDSFVIERAKASVEEAMAQQRAEHERAVREEAKQLVAQQQRDALAKQVAAEVAAHEQKIKEIKAAAAKASAAL